MEPTKFENNIRQKLEEREIQPSSKAWENLEAMLPKEQSKRGLSIWWYAVAATLVGVLLMVGVYNSLNTNTVDVPLATEETEIPLPQPSPVIEENNTLPVAVEEVTSVKEQTPQNIKKVKVNTGNNNATKPIASSTTKTETTIVSQEVTNKEKNIDALQINLKKDITVSTQVDKVVAQVQELQNKNNTVTVTEVEKLLADAQKEITTQRILSSSNVDPMALLGDVEFELQKSFKDKVFLALGDGYDAMKEVILDRNN